MVHFSDSLSRLLAELQKLPGVGEKTALRLAFHLLKSPDNAAALADSLRDVMSRVRFCSVCFGITEDDPCRFCSEARDDGAICVVEEPQDLLAVERTRAFRGRYHVLQGALSPLNGVTPDRLRVAELMKRLEGGGVREVVIATNFSVEGEATALYLARMIKPLGVRVTRLAHGIPLGSDLEFVDAATVQRALEGRSEL
ncbi:MULTISPECIES: recombination mediator RecR [Geobacter]|mgnify:CR=1 FL=1|uniref:Recombination protein RecR n=2 Tax=Geobacter TaxID=28231 RepID=A0A0C1U7P9_9BACT|nr:MULTISPECIES: recombination mediator RecR [Geobacter]ANA41479.1 recombination protein RecR [Geobacter anodireducens]KIE43670.1 recombinase RecR [Geobacter soli]MBE2888541.1 recombination protein RecR [Geobacter anodireducens]HMN01648.1 recombination mediator RecR [Geobacter anodireducens]